MYTMHCTEPACATAFTERWLIEAPAAAATCDAPVLAERELHDRRRCLGGCTTSISTRYEPGRLALELPARSPPGRSLAFGSHLSLAPAWQRPCGGIRIKVKHSSFSGA